MQEIREEAFLFGSRTAIRAGNLISDMGNVKYGTWNLRSGI